MRARALLRKIDRLEKDLARGRQIDTGMLDLLRRDPAASMIAARLPPDPWQRQVLETDSNRILLNCTRQSGKSTVAAGLALGTALTRPGDPVLLLSPTERQSVELFRKVIVQFDAIGRPVPVISETQSELELENGSRIISLPGTQKTTRSFSGVSMLVIDEAAQVEDSLYLSVRPMLAVSKGRLLVLSTPFGKRGWFYEAWSGIEAWERVQIKAEECPRIDPEFLEEERRVLGERWFRQEYCCSFEETCDAVFASEDIQAALCDISDPAFRELGG